MLDLAGFQLTSSSSLVLFLFNEFICWIRWERDLRVKSAANFFPSVKKIISSRLKADFSPFQGPYQKWIYHDHFFIIWNFQVGLCQYIKRKVKPVKLGVPVCSQYPILKRFISLTLEKRKMPEMGLENLKLKVATLFFFKTVCGQCLNSAIFLFLCVSTCVVWLSR